MFRPCQRLSRQDSCAFWLHHKALDLRLDRLEFLCNTCIRPTRSDKVDKPIEVAVGLFPQLGASPFEMCDPITVSRELVGTKGTARQLDLPRFGIDEREVSAGDLTGDRFG